MPQSQSAFWNLFFLSGSVAIRITVWRQEKYPTHLLSQVDHYGLCHTGCHSLFYLYYSFILLLSYFNGNRQDWRTGQTEKEKLLKLMNLLFVISGFVPSSSFRTNLRTERGCCWSSWRSWRSLESAVEKVLLSLQLYSKLVSVLDLQSGRTAATSEFIRLTNWNKRFIFTNSLHHYKICVSICGSRLWSVVMSSCQTAHVLFSCSTWGSSITLTRTCQSCQRWTLPLCDAWTGRKAPQRSDWVHWDYFIRSPQCINSVLCLFGFRLWRSSAPWSTVHPLSEPTEQRWLKWSLPVYPTCT